MIQPMMLVFNFNLDHFSWIPMSLEDLFPYHLVILQKFYQPIIDLRALLYIDQS